MAPTPRGNDAASSVIFLQFCHKKLARGKVDIVPLRSSYIGVTEVSANIKNVDQIRVAQIRAFKRSPAQIRAAKIRAGKIRAGKIGESQIRAGKIGGG